MDLHLPELAVARLTIADRQGRARIVLGLEDGDPAIRILAADGQELVRIGLSSFAAGTRGHEAPAGVTAELQLGACDKGAQFVAQAGPSGEGFVELGSAPGESFAAVLIEVDQPGGVHRARLSVRDSQAVLEAEASEGAVRITRGGEPIDPSGPSP